MKLNPVQTAVVIQRWWLRHRPVNNTCSLTLDRLEPPVFRFYPGQNRSRRPIGYSLASLLQYFQATGKLVDPCTREPYNRLDIERLDLLMTRYNLHDVYKSPVRAKEELIQAVSAEVVASFRAAMYPREELVEATEDRVDAVLIGVMPVLFTAADKLLELQRLDPERAKFLWAALVRDLQYDPSPWKCYYRVYTELEGFVFEILGDL